MGSFCKHLLGLTSFGVSLWLPVMTYAAEQVVCSGSPQRTTCRIDEPNVTRRLSQYPQITFRPGDRVTVEAGGCVQTGGTGRTWKRYVDPSGANSERLYHGLIQIPGAQSDLVRVAGLVNHPVDLTPSTFPLREGFLRLGYEDDDYGDNGYYSHDDGTDDQCRGVGNAFVVLTIDHGTAQDDSAAPFDLVFTETDPNGFPLNAQWAWQRDHPGSLPDADTQCFNLPGVFSNTKCSTQSPSIDIPTGWNATWCSAGAAHNIHGHVNWMPATWQGPVLWEGHSDPGADDDYNINLVPAGNRGLTASSEGHIHAEFDSDETIDHFRTPWWRNFHDAVDRDDASARALIDNKFAIIIGLAGLDCEHGCATELHPVYALAVHVNDNPLDDTWAMFARNWGNEGYCSQDQHLLDTGRIAFFIPQPSASDVQINVATTFLTNSQEATGPSITLVAGKGAIVEFGLPDPSKGARVNGELHLKWTVAAGPRAPSPAANIFHLSAEAGVPGKMEVEERLEELQKRLSPNARRALKSKLARERSLDQIRLTRLQPTPSPQVDRPPTSRAVFDERKAKRDMERARAMCQAFGRNIPGNREACARIPQ